MDPGQLNMFHYGRYKGISTVGNGICLNFNSVFQELVDQDRPFRGHIHCRSNIMLEHLLVVDHFHATAAQHIGGSHHQGITYPFSDLECFFQGAGHARFGLGNTQLPHLLAKPIPVLGQIDGVRRSPDDFDPGFGQFICNVKRSLSPELHNDTFRLLFFVNAQHILYCKRLKVEFIGRVIVGGYGLGIAVDHNGLKTLIAKSKGSVYAAVVKLNPLPYPVGATA